MLMLHFLSVFLVCLNCLFANPTGWLSDFSPGFQADYDDDRNNDEDIDLLKKTKESHVFVGDMMLTNDQYDYLYSNNTLKRHGLKNAVAHWPEGKVPIKIEGDFEAGFVETIEEAAKYISSVSCITFDFKPENPVDYVTILNGDGCSSQVGNMRVGAQSMKLSDHCSKGNIVHEFLHTLGFLHMHTAVDRDSFVKINWENIKEQAKKNFDKYVAHVSMYKTQYDYRSIMHYSRKAFAIDQNKPTIIPFEKVSNMGQRSIMTEGDITRLNRMYSCSQYKEEEGTEEAIGSSDSIQDELVEEEVGGLVLGSPAADKEGMKMLIDGNRKAITEESFEEIARVFIDHMKPVCKLNKKLKALLKNYAVKL